MKSERARERESERARERDSERQAYRQTNKTQKQIRMKRKMETK